MSTMDIAPTVQLKNFKRVKIIATIGPATDSYEAILSLIKAGANGLRLNCSHGNNEERSKQIKWIRKASRECSKPVAIIWDLQGPKIRLGDFEGIFNVAKGQEFSLGYLADYAQTGHLPTQYDLSEKVKRGERLYLYDGRVRTTVSSVRAGIIHVRAENDGILIKRKGINLPDTDFGGDVITAKDRTDLVYGSTQDIDYVGISFVQTADDILSFQKLLKVMNISAKVIAKIETKAAVANIEAITRATDALMVARGDLAVEIPAESVPVVQRQMVSLGLQYTKPVVVATQMLLSMTLEPAPTRAEVSDVATAVLMGADCVMLSEESAIGNHPIEAVATMKRIIRYTETYAHEMLVLPERKTDQVRQAAISTAIISLASNIAAKAIVAETKSGATALQIAAHRTTIPLIAVTSDRRVAQQLTIVYGVKSFVRPVTTHAAGKLTDWLRHGKLLNKGDIVVTVSGQHPGVVGTTDTIKVRMIE
jgi:pyruvate kinase